MRGHGAVPQFLTQYYHRTRCLLHHSCGMPAVRLVRTFDRAAPTLLRGSMKG
jgi:hypothetical protein